MWDRSARRQRRCLSPMLTGLRPPGASQAHLSQTLFLPPAASPAGQPTPASSYFNAPPAPPSSLTMSSASFSNTNGGPHPSPGQAGSWMNRAFDQPSGGRGPIPERGFGGAAGSSFASNNGSHYHPGASSTSSSTSGSYSAFLPPPAPAPTPASQTPLPDLSARQTRSQTRASAAQQQQLQHNGSDGLVGVGSPTSIQQGGWGTTMTASGQTNGRGQWAPPPSRSTSVVRGGSSFGGGGGGGGGDFEMGD